MKRRMYLWITIVSCVFGVSQGLTQPISDPNPPLKIGIVQRFGAKSTDRISLKALTGDRLQVQFPGKTLSTQQLTVEVSPSPLAVPQIEEKIILSFHRSFENAQASAHRWEAKGIETEIVQPDRWEVWAKRSAYPTPLLRQMLLTQIRLMDNEIARLETRLQKKQPRLAWVIDGVRYEGDTLDISSNQSVTLVNQNPYGGNLRFQPNAFGSFTLVNTVPIETYLRGVVPHEIGYQAPYAAIQAQAVLARTYALANRHRFAVDNYELCANTHCQVYAGLKDTSSLADRAIRDTRGKVLTYGGKVVDALYSSTTGGVTANYNDLWDGKERPYLRSVFDTVQPPNGLNLSQEPDFRAFLDKQAGFNEAGWRTFRWQKTSTLAEMTTTLRAFLRKSGDTSTQFKQITAVTIAERSPSGRVLKMRVKTDTGTLTIEKDEIRDAFYAPGSTLFYLEPQYKDTKIVAYTFIGGGLGHGVGMSQTGSYNLGRLGWNYQKILGFYFRGTTLETLQPQMIALE